MRGRRAAEERFELERWDSRMHLVMEELGVRLGVAGTSRKRLLAVMGKPDDVGRPGDQLWIYRLVAAPESGESAAATEMLVYYWRGVHDFLFFDLRGDVVLRSGWWFAGE